MRTIAVERRIFWIHLLQIRLAQADLAELDWIEWIISLMLNTSFWKIWRLIITWTGSPWDSFCFRIYCQEILLLVGSTAHRRWNSTWACPHTCWWCMEHWTENTNEIISCSCSPPLGASPGEAAMQLDMMEAVPALAAVDVHPLADKQSDWLIRNPLPRPGWAAARLVRGGQLAIVTGSVFSTGLLCKDDFATNPGSQEETCISYLFCFLSLQDTAFC